MAVYSVWICSRNRVYIGNIHQNDKRAGHCKVPGMAIRFLGEFAAAQRFLCCKPCNALKHMNHLTMKISYNKRLQRNGRKKKMLSSCYEN